MFAISAQATPQPPPSIGDEGVVVDPVFSRIREPAELPPINSDAPTVSPPPQHHHEVEIDPAADLSSTREPADLTPINATFTFPDRIRALLQQNGMRHVLSDCVEYHVTQTVAPLRQAAPNVDWDPIVREMRFSTTLLAVGDDAYFVTNPSQMNTAEAVLRGSKPLWSTHEVLGASVQELHTFLEEQVDMFGAPRADTTHPSNLKGSSAAAVQPTSSAARHLGAATSQSVSHQGEAPRPASSDIPLEPTAHLPPQTISNVSQTLKKKNQHHKIKSVLMTDRSLVASVGHLARHLGKCGFKARPVQVGFNTMLAEGSRIPAACFYHNAAPSDVDPQGGDDLDYSIVGQYVHGGGVFVYSGSRSLPEERKAFPQLKWGGQRDDGDASLPLGMKLSEAGSGILGDEFSTLPLVPKKRMHVRNVPKHEAILAAVDAKYRPVQPYMCSLAIHAHGAGVYIYVGDTSLHHYTVHIIRRLLAVYCKPDTPRQNGPYLSTRDIVAVAGEEEEFRLDGVGEEPAFVNDGVEDEFPLKGKDADVDEDNTSGNAVMGEVHGCSTGSEREEEDEEEEVARILAGLGDMLCDDDDDDDGFEPLVDSDEWW